MAILFCRAQVIKRSEGRSAVACAAYRCGMTLEDTRTGQTHDYSRKHGVIAQGILTPDHAPEWAQDPRQLWNRVEAAETRRDAQLARELVIALPHEIEGEHREYLLKNILRPLVRNGAVAHYMLHEPSLEGDERNVHAHVMLTMRRIEGQEFGHKAREWNDKTALQEVKKTIERETNRMLERLGHDQRVSVELADGQQPTRHMGPKATQLERQGLKTECGEENRRIQKENNRRQELERLKAQTEREIAELEAQQEAERQRRAEEERRKAAEAGQEPPSPAASWWQASHARAAMHAPIPAPSNDNQQNTPEAPPKRREHVPRTPAARAFERAQQPEKAPQPEPPRRRTEQREAFNKAAQSPTEPAKVQESRLDRILREREERQRRERQEERAQGQGRSLADEWQDRLRKGPR